MKGVSSGAAVGLLTGKACIHLQVIFVIPLLGKLAGETLRRGPHQPRGEGRYLALCGFSDECTHNVNELLSDDGHLHGTSYD